MWKMLAPYLRAHRGVLAGALALNALSGVATAFQALAPKYLLDDVLLPAGLSLAERGWRLGALLVAYLLASVVLRMMAWHAGFRLFARVRERVVFELRARFFRQINAMCPRFHGRHQSGELFSYLFGSPLAQVQHFFQELAMSGPGALFIVLSTLAWVGTWDWALALVLIGSVGASALLMRRAEIGMEAVFRDYHRVEGDVSGQVADLIRGGRAIQLHAAEERTIARFEGQADAIARKSYERDVQVHRHWMTQEAAGYFFFVLLCAVGSWRYMIGEATAGELLACLSAFTVLQGPLQQLFQIGAAQGSARASLMRLDAVLREQSTVPEPAEPLDPAACVGSPEGWALEGVEFAHGSHPVLRGVTLQIRPGERVALVGPSGSGKSTVAQLLLRFHDPDAGRVTWGGVDVRRFRPRDLRRLFGVVPQDPYMFQATVRENLRLGCPEADDAAIRRACERANAWEFISKMPEGLESMVGEGGASLSGGQKQRLALARALLADPPCFIFDEATSALDPVSERLIQESLEEVLPGRMALFIAHRLATVRQATRILVLVDGRIEQEGTYDELAGREGPFRSMLEASAWTGAEEGPGRPG